MAASRWFLVVAASVCAVLALPATAQVRWYAGLGGGWTRTADVGGNIAAAAGATEARTNIDERGGAWKGFAGARVTRWLAIEAAYADLGRARAGSDLMAGVPPLPAAVTLRRKAEGAGIDALLFLPWRAAGLEFFGKGGAYRTRLTVDATLEGNIDFADGPERTRRATHRETTPHYGMGVQWLPSQGVAVRLEVERYRAIGTAFAAGQAGGTGEANVDAAWLSVLARF